VGCLVAGTVGGLAKSMEDIEKIKKAGIEKLMAQV
jgi:hypothetical protein